MIRSTNGRRGGKNEVRSPIVDSCSPPAVGSRLWPMVLSDHCRNCSVRLIPPHSVRPQTAALRPRATRLLVRVRENRSIQVSSNDADHRATFSQPHGDRSERRLWQTGIPSHHRRPEESGAEVHQGHVRREEAQQIRSTGTERRLLQRLSGTPAPTAAPRHGSTVSYTNFRVARKYADNEFGGENADCNAGRRAGRLDSAENAR